MPGKIQLVRTTTRNTPSKRKLAAYVWKIADIGLDNDQDGIIEQSLIENSCRNLEFIFHKDYTGVIIQKNETEALTFLFKWEINYKNPFITIIGEHPLFCIKTKWSIQQGSNYELRLSYSIKLSGQLVTVLMRMKGNRIRRRIRTKQFLQMILLPLFYL